MLSVKLGEFSRREKSITDGEWCEKRTPLIERWCDECTRQSDKDLAMSSHGDGDGGDVGA